MKELHAMKDICKSNPSEIHTIIIVGYALSLLLDATVFLLLYRTSEHPIYFDLT